MTLRPYTRGSGALHAVFNTTDEKLLKQIKSPIAHIFSLTSTASFEGLVDDVLKCLLEKFDRRFAANGEIFDLGQWLQFFAFDVMGTMTFSKRYGFLDNGRDVGGTLGSIVNFMRAAAPVKYFLYCLHLVSGYHSQLTGLSDDTNPLARQDHEEKPHRRHPPANVPSNSIHFDSRFCSRCHQREAGKISKWRGQGGGQSRRKEGLSNSIYRTSREKSRNTSLVRHRQHRLQAR